MKYKIAIHESDEGYSVSVPGLPGCWSQGASEQEALDNIREAIREYLSVVEEQLRGEEVREVEITVQRLPKVAGVNQLDAVRAFEKAGFWIARQGKHIVMTNGQCILTVPRHNPVNAFTMGGLVRDARLSVEQFRKLLQALAAQQGPQADARDRYSIFQAPVAGAAQFGRYRAEKSSVLLVG